LPEKGNCDILSGQEAIDLKRFAALVLALVLLLPAMGAAEGKVSSLPTVLNVEYTVDEHFINSKMSFVYKEHVKTALSHVDAEINGLADRLEEAGADQLQPDKNKNAKRNSRLDVHIVTSRCGQKCLSFLVLARDTYYRRQRWSPFETRVFNMETGEKVALSDLFAPDSAAWEVLSAAVREGLTAYFPKEAPDEAALNALCSREGIENAAFMLGPVCLTLHYEARTLYPDRPTLMRVSVPYSRLEGMMTAYGAELTDNSMYKMVALTFDDGPSYNNSIKIINSLRQAGAQATFFLVGDRIEEYKDVVMRENDENHSLQSHHYKHVDADKSTVERVQAYTERFYNTLTEAVGTAPLMLRAPYGNFKMFQKAKIGMPFIEWDVDTKDWTKSSSTAKVMSVVRELTKDGSILLMHDIKEKTPASAQAVIQWLHENGYLCVTVEDLFYHNGQPLTPHKIFFRIDPYTGEQEET